MAIRKVITFGEGGALFSPTGFSAHLQLSDLERASANRFDQTTSSKAIVENETGLKCYLEDLLIQGQANLNYIRVALDNLGGFNEQYGHDGADKLLQETIAKLAEQLPGKENLRLFRSGADWILVFAGPLAAKEQSAALNWLETTAKPLQLTAGKSCTLSYQAVAQPLNRSTLKTTYEVLNNLRPGKITAAEALKNFPGILVSGEAQALSGPTLLTLEPSSQLKSYSGRQKEYQPQLLDETTAQNLRELMVKGMSYETLLAGRKELLKQRLLQFDEIDKQKPIEVIDAEDYLREYRVEGSYVFMTDENTMVIPITNTFGEVVLAVRVKRAEPDPQWNEPSRRIKYSSAQRPTFVVREDDPVLKGFFMPPINTALSELLFLRRFDAQYALFEPSGRTMFFGRTVEPYVNHLMGLSAAALEKLPEDFGQPMELRAIAKIILRDGFIMLRCGGEEFFVVARDKQNHWFGMAYDYNKFSRFGTTFGEVAADFYMQRSAGILRYELGNTISARYKKGLPFSPRYLASVLNSALRRMNNRALEYAVPENVLDREIRTKSGKQIFAVHAQGEWYLFAASSAEELATNILNSKPELDEPTRQEWLRRATQLGPLTSRSVITVINRDSQGVAWQNNVPTLDLNKVLGVNPKAVFTGEPLAEPAIALHPGNLSLSVLSGLSLAGSVLAWDGKTQLQRFINIADTVAERAKALANGLRAQGHQQGMNLNFTSSFAWNGTQQVVVSFGD